MELLEGPTFGQLQKKEQQPVIHNFLLLLLYLATVSSCEQQNRPWANWWIFLVCLCAGIRNCLRRFSGFSPDPAGDRPAAFRLYAAPVASSFYFIHNMAHLIVHYKKKKKAVVFKLTCYFNERDMMGYLPRRRLKAAYPIRTFDSNCARRHIFTENSSQGR